MLSRETSRWRADRPESEGDAEGHDRRVHAEDAEPVVIGLARDTDEHEGCAVCAKERHEEYERPEPTPGEEVLL